MPPDRGFQAGRKVLAGVACRGAVASIGFCCRGPAGFHIHTVKL